MDSAREDLDHLVKSPGWARFCQHIEQEWGTAERGGGAMFTQAARKAANISDDASSLAQLRQICVAQREIHNLISWVRESLKDATKADERLVAAGPTDYSRRGGL